MDEEQTFWDHLQAFRRVLWRMVVVLLLLFPFGWWGSGPLLELYIAYACPPELGSLNYFTPMEVFLVEMKMGLLLAVAAGFPLLSYLFWNFLRPALYHHERSRVGWNVAAGYALFLGGSAFALGVIVPLVMRFSAGFASGRLQPMIGLGAFLELAFWMALAFGVMFQMPLVVVGLCRLGVVRAETLRRKRPIIVVAVLIVAALLTPPDVVSQLMLAVPTLILFEIGLWLAGRGEKNPAPESVDDIAPPEAEPESGESTDNGGLSFYAAQAKRRKHRPLRGSRRR